MKNSLDSIFSSISKYVAGFIGTLAFRLTTPLIGGLSNVSPLMATELTGSKAYGPFIGSLYGALSMIMLDAIVGRIGSWTIITAITYGIVGLWGGFFLKTRDASSRNFIIASIIGTLFFDLITGVLMGPILYNQPWIEAIIGQIPFTLRHLAGNVAFAGLLAPWFYRKVMNNPSWNLALLFKFA